MLSGPVQSSKTSGARPVPQLAPDSGLYEVAKAGDHIYTKGSEYRQF